MPTRETTMMIIDGVLDVIDVINGLNYDGNSVGFGDVRIELSRFLKLVEIASRTKGDVEGAMEIASRSDLNDTIYYNMK